MLDNLPSPYYGKFGGMFVPEILVPALEQLETCFLGAINDDAFNDEFYAMLKTYAGRETPLTLCQNISPNPKVKIYLKREDLLHGGAHKTNQVIGQCLLAKRMGKQRLIAETGAGQHGVAMAIVGARMGLDVTIYMGAKDVERQQQNVFRMRLMGARVIAVDSGSGTLKDAINEAMRDWSASYEHTHYVLGTAAGPHPFPLIVKHFQTVIGREAKQQVLAVEGRLPDALYACVGGGSNAIGLFADFIDEPDVSLIGVEPAGKGLDISGQHGATLGTGSNGILHGAITKIMQNDDGQISKSHSISAGLDYPGVGPEHAFLQDSGRVTYTSVTDQEALDAFHLLSRHEGIIPALESAHAVAQALKDAQQRPDGSILLVNLSGRGDKDLAQVMKHSEKEAH